MTSAYIRYIFASSNNLKPKAMKATISDLWETGRRILSFDNSEYERPQNFKDLKQCDNVLIGDKIYNDSHCKIREVLIDNSIVLVEPNKVCHPCGGTMYILEVL